MGNDFCVWKVSHSSVSPAAAHTGLRLVGSPAPTEPRLCIKLLARRHLSPLIPPPAAWSDGRANTIISTGNNLSGVIAASGRVLVLLNYSCWAEDGEAAGEPRALGAALGAAAGGAARAWEDTPLVRVGERPRRPWPQTQVGSLGLVSCVLGCLARSAGRPNTW